MAGMIRSFEKKSPRVDATAFVHDAAEVIGAVTLGAGASVWPHAVLRGDVDAIRVGARTNIQDNTVVHCREGRPAVIGKGVTVGHSAVIHGSVIGDFCLIGMGAVVMEAVLGKECIVAAGAMVPKGLKIPARSLVMGLPAKVFRKLNAEEIRSLHDSERSYVKLAERHRRTSKVLF
jgi:carbonic anhydrase/acetyltransferase-like protein (isoleucine patch superfamily)